MLFIVEIFDNMIKKIITNVKLTHRCGFKVAIFFNISSKTTQRVIIPFSML